jgi:hypothetical protein
MTSRPFCASTTATNSDLAAASGAQATAAATSHTTHEQQHDDDGPVTLEVYRSPAPTLWMAVARLFAVKKYIALSAAAVVGVQRVAQAGASWADVQASLLGYESAAGDAALAALQLPTYFLALGLFGHVASRLLVNRTVIGIDAVMPASHARRVRTVKQRGEEVAGAPEPYEAELAARSEMAEALQPAAAAGHQIVLYRPSLWRGAAAMRPQTVARSDIACAPPNKTDLVFELSLPSGRRVHQHLWPLPGWRSANRPYLCALLYHDYWRSEAPPPADTGLLRGIEGFGPYRPAQFADLWHPTALAPLIREAAGSADGHVRARAVEGTPFFVEHDTVWARFDVPPRPSLAARREAERLSAVEGRAKAAAALQGVPRLPAPVTLMLDGSHYVEAGQQQQQQLQQGAAVTGAIEAPETAADSEQQRSGR